MLRHEDVPPLPPFQRERLGTTLADPFALVMAMVGALLVASAWEVRFKIKGTIAPAMYIGLILAPPWIHLRMRERVMLVTGDHYRLDDLRVAGLAGLGGLRAHLRAPLSMAVTVPVVSLFTVVNLKVFLAVFEMSPVEWPVLRVAEIAMELLLGVAAIALGLAGVFDLLGHRCRGTGAFAAAVCSSVWVLGSMFIIPCAIFALPLEVLVVAVLVASLAALAAERKRDRLGRDSVLFTLTGRRLGELLGGTGKAARRARIGVALWAGSMAAMVLFVALLHLKAITMPRPHDPIIVAVRCLTAAMLATLLLADRLAYAARAFRYGEA